MKCTISLLFTIALYSFCSAQGPLYSNLPVGKYKIGFKIITLTDSSRVSKPAINYFGEKESGNRYQKISIHLWYPAIPNSGKGNINYAGYCYNHLLSGTKEDIKADQKSAAISAMRASQERFFGNLSDENWQQIAATTMLAQKDAEPLHEKFPLLIGMLRPLSTTVTNELMASNGYVVAMVLSTSGRVPLGYITDVTDMQQAIAFISKTGQIDENSIGSYGFSGSGFSQVLLTMNDSRIGALADIESALYGEGIWSIFSSSDYYDVSKLQVPFLHIYGKYLGQADLKFDEFHNTKYSQRYHLLLNQSRLHHWDVATEGRASTTIVHTRGEIEPGIKASFELANIYLLNFFNAVLKKMPASQKILDNKSSITGYNDSLWTIRQYPALKPPPDRQQFKELIIRKGVEEGIQLARYYRSADSTAAFIHENALNATAREFQDENKLKEGLPLMQLATEFYPDRAWLWRNLSGLQEAAGDIPGAIRSCEKVLELLKDYKGAEQSFNERIRKSAQEILARLKK